MALGLFLSAFARTEFQAVQFLPAFVMPQLLLCGLFAARDSMATPLRWLSDVFPLSYAVDGMQQLAASSSVTGALARDLVVVAGASLAALALGAATLRRQTP
jgi:ABC-2 type transport system permease protein